LLLHFFGDLDHKIHIFTRITIKVLFATICFAYSTSVVVPEDTIECDLCHFIVGEVTNYLEQNKTQTFIIKEIVRVCSTELFKDYAQVCESIIEFGVQEFILFIQTEETPTNVCGPLKLDLCSSKIDFIQE